MMTDTTRLLLALLADTADTFLATDGQRLRRRPDGSYDIEENGELVAADVDLADFVAFAVGVPGR